MSEDMMKMFQALAKLDETDDIKDIIEMDVDSLNEEIENERILKDIITSLRIFIPTAKKLCKAYIELYQLAESGELD